MNREIKFRFWCKGTSENLNFNKCGWWTYPNFLLDKYFASFDIFKSKDFVACQYTGLKDSKGKEIYEGDILTSSSINGFRFLYRAEFYEGSFLKPYIFRQMADGEPEVVGRANNNIDFNILTVVGNIFCDEFKMLD